jgi:hypothetical protein
MKTWSMVISEPTSAGICSTLIFRRGNAILLATGFYDRVHGALLPSAFFRARPRPLSSLNRFYSLIADDMKELSMSSSGNGCIRRWCWCARSPSTSSHAGGKRMRPALVLLCSAGACGYSGHASPSRTGGGGRIHSYRDPAAR